MASTSFKYIPHQQSWLTNLYYSFIETAKMQFFVYMQFHNYPNIAILDHRFECHNYDRILKKESRFQTYDCHRLRWQKELFHKLKQYYSPIYLNVIIIS